MPTCPKGHNSAAADYCDVCGRSMTAPASTPAAPPPPAPAESGETCPSCGTPRTGRFCELDGYDFLTANLNQAAPASARPAAVPATPAAQPVAAGAQPVAAAQSVAAGAPPVADGQPAPVPPGSAQPGSAHPGSYPSAAAQPVEVASPADSPLASGQPAAPDQEQPAAVDMRKAEDAVGTTAVVSADRAYFELVRGAGGPDAGILVFPDYCPERRFPLRGSQLLIGRRSRSRGLNPEIDLTGPPEDPGVSHSHALLLPHVDGGWAVVDLGSANGTHVNDTSKPIPVHTPVPVGPGDRLYLGAWTVLVIA